MKRRLLFLFPIIFVLSPFFIQAQIFVSANATGNNDGSSWTDAYIDLQSALDDTSDGSIWIAKGTYVPNMKDSARYYLVEREVNLYGGFNGTESNLSDRDPAANKTILSGDVNGDDVQGDPLVNRIDNAAHILYVLAQSTKVQIDGIQFISGNTSLEDNGESGFYLRGGAIYSFATLIVSNCSFSECAGRSGAAIQISNSDGSNISDCNFFDNYNTAQAILLLASCSNTIIENSKFNFNTTSRGAIYTLTSVGISIKNCDISENIGHPDNWGGTALFNWNSIDVNVSNTKLNKNVSFNNAAVLYCDGREISEGNQMHFQDCEITSNDSPGYGGNLYFWEAEYTMDGCTISKNTAPNGAGVYHGNTKFLISNTTFDGNAAEFGGACLNYNIRTDGLYKACTFESNIASTSGGVGNIGFLGSASFEDCDFSLNQAQWGGCFYMQNDTSVVNFNDCNFNGNSANNFGGALVVNGSYDIGIYDCFFEANSANFGGAVSIIDDSLDFGKAEIHNCIFSYNFAETQGGALNLGNYDAEIRTSLFGNNEATDTGNGGAISNNSSAGQDANLNIFNTTIAENAGSLASGISNYDDIEADGNAKIELTNTILFNLNGGGDYVVEEGEPILISNGGNHAFLPTLGSIFTGLNDQVEEAPLFISLGLGDYNLAGDSPCIDTGVPENAHETDLNGDPLVGTVDKGCYENQTGPIKVKNVLSDRTAQLINNPTESETTLELKHAYLGNLNITITDLNGKIFSAFSFEKNEGKVLIPLSVKEYPTGTYFVNIEMKSKILTKKLVKI